MTSASGPWRSSSARSSWRGSSWRSRRPTSAIFGAVLGVAVGLGAFRLFVPNDMFPVTYKRGKAAHLDVGGSRGEAIRHAVADQLGEQVGEIKPIGLEGSGGSTPLRLTIERADGSHRYVFAKLYAMSHVRADRWYKLGRHDPLRRARGRDAVRLGPAVRRVRGLRAASALRRGVREPRAVRHRRDHPGARVHDPDGVLRRRRRDQRGRGDAGGDRRGPPDDPPDVGPRRRAPRHQAGQPHGPRRSPASDRRVLRAGAARRRGARPSTSRT